MHLGEMNNTGAVVKQKIGNGLSAQQKKTKKGTDLFCETQRGRFVGFARFINKSVPSFFVAVDPISPLHRIEIPEWFTPLAPKP